MTGNGISRNNVSNYTYPVGFGYIVIPSDEDRDKYIETCLRKERVSILLDGGGSIISNCYISREALNGIKFPEDSDDLGSCVAFISPKFNNLPIIVGIISKADETQLLEEDSFKRQVSTDGALVTIEGKGKTGELFVTVESEFENEGNINIALKSKNNTSKFNLKCFGDITIDAEGGVDLKASDTVKIRSTEVIDGVEEIKSKVEVNNDGVIVKDYWGNKITTNSSGEIRIEPSDKCLIFEGSHPLVKGDTLKDELEKAKKRIDKIIEALTAGSGAASSATTYSAAVMLVINTITSTEDYDNINSEKSFTD